MNKEIIKDELIKEFIEDFFDIENFKIIEMPYIKGYVLTDKNNKTILITAPWFTENTIQIILEDKIIETFIKTKDIQGKKIWKAI